MSKELKKRPPAELATTSYADHADGGFENETGEDLQIPFLALLQDDSRVVNDGLGASGSLFNTVTEEDLGREVLFVPSYIEKYFVEWIPRNKGGGFVARHECESEIVARAKAESTEFAKYRSPAGNDLIETIYVYGALCGEDIQPVVIAFTSSKIKVYRRWNTCVNLYRHEEPDGSMVRPPRFAHLLKIGVVEEENKAMSKTFWNFTLTPANGGIKESLLTPDDSRFIAAMGFGELVKGGRARAAEESLNKTSIETDNY